MKGMCENYSWHHFMVYQFAEQRRKVSAGERLPADRCECLLATFYVVSSVEEDVWELFLASFYGVPVCGAEEESFSW